MGDPDDHATMIVQFEFGADFRVFEFVELGILDRYEGVFGKNVFDVPGIQGRPAEQAAVVQPDDIGGLIGAVGVASARRLLNRAARHTSPREYFEPRRERSPAVEWYWRRSESRGPLPKSMRRC